MIIKQDDGTEVEVFTAEELEVQKEAAKQQAIDDFRAENPDKSEELTELQQQLEEKTAELEKFKTKDLNFGNLRKQKEDVEKKIGEIEKQVDEKINIVKKEVLEGVMREHYNDTLKALAGDDDEVRKKIEFHYKRLGDAAGTKLEVANKLRDAYILATRVEEVDALTTSVISSGGVGRINPGTKQQSFSPDEKDLAKKFGLNEEDIKKYGSQ